MSTSHHERRLDRTLATLVMLAASTIALASCGEGKCLMPPCPMPIAITLTLIDAATGAPVQGATVEVTGAQTGGGVCGSPCPLPGTAGTYNIEVTAAGFEPARRTVVVPGTTPSCRCPTVDPQTVTIALVASPPQ